MNFTVSEIETTLPDGCSIRGRLYTPNSNHTSRDLCLCIHGLAVDCNVWNFVAEEWVQSGRSLVCFDLRGHGLSDRGRWYKVGPKIMARDLIQACHQLNLKPSTLIAQSFGNLIALHMLVRTPNNWDIGHYFAVTPVWTATRPKTKIYFRLLRDAFIFLFSLGKEVGFTNARMKKRSDHTKFAKQADSFFPRFCEETRSIGWLRYARLMLLLQWSRWHVHAWTSLKNLPVHIIGATGEGLWDNSELMFISEKTGWPLHWIEMRHLSLSTNPKYAHLLIKLIENKQLTGSK